VVAVSLVKPQEVSGGLARGDSDALMVMKREMGQTRLG
jgi:hypothetical protein